MKSVMNRVLVLTKNIFTERELQNKLQLLDYEVYCSARLLDECIEKQYHTEFLNFFQYVILSESINVSELATLVAFFEPLSLKVIRKVGTKIMESDQHYLKKGLLNALISTNDSLDELRESLSLLSSSTEQSVEYTSASSIKQLSQSSTIFQANILQSSFQKSEETLYLELLYCLSNKESRIISILIKAGNQVVSREELCRELWGETPNHSHLASLSNSIKKIKAKFEKSPLKVSAIHTLWGRGYHIDQELLNKVKSSEELTHFLTV